RDADDDAHPPALVAAFERLTHRLHVADALEAVIRASARELDEMGDKIALYLVWIDEIRHAELRGERASRRVEIDPDNLRRTHHPCALDDIEPDATEPEHDDARAGLDFRRVDDGADTRRDAAADVADLLHRRVGTDFRHRDLGKHGV